MRLISGKDFSCRPAGAQHHIPHRYPLLAERLQTCRSYGARALQSESGERQRRARARAESDSESESESESGERERERERITIPTNMPGRFQIELVIRMFTHAGRQRLTEVWCNTDFALG